MSVAALIKPVCDLCDVKYCNMQDLNKHMANIHFETDNMRLNRLQTSLTSESNKKPKSVPSVDTVTVNDIRNNKSTDCSECGIFFNTKETHATHIEEHHIKKVEEAKICDKTLVIKKLPKQSYGAKS